MERARGRGDRAFGPHGVHEPRDSVRQDLHADLVPRDGESRKAGRPGCRLRDAAVLPLSGARLRLRLSDDGAVPAARWAGVLRRLQVHRLPILHARVSVGRADRGMGLTRPEDRKVHALRRSSTPACADHVQRATGPPRRDPTVPRDDRDPGVRQGVPRGRPALRNPRGDARSRPQAHRGPPGQVRRPHLRREGGRRHDGAVRLRGAFRETRVPDVRGEAVSEVHGGGPRGRASRRHGDRRGARRRLRLLQEARARGRGRRRYTT